LDGALARDGGDSPGRAEVCQGIGLEEQGDSRLKRHDTRNRAREDRPASHVRIFDKRDDLHEAPTVRAEQRVQFEHLLDEACPVAASGLRRGDVVGERDGERPERLLLQLLTTAPTALNARVVRVIADQVLAAIRNMRSDCREKVQRVEEHLVRVGSRGPLGLVDDRALGNVVADPLPGERGPDQIARQVLTTRCVVGADAHRGVDVESRVLPGLHQLHPLGTEQALLDEQLADPVPEELLHRGQAHRRQSVKGTIGRKRAVSCHDMQVRVVVEQVAIRVHANHQPGLRLRCCQQNTETLDDHAGGHPAQIPEQSPVIAKVDAQHLGDREHDLPVRYRQHYRRVQPLGEGYGPLGVTGCAEIPPLAGEGQQVLVPTVRTADAGEAQFEVTTVEVLVDRLANDRAEVTVPVLVALRIDLLKALEVLLDDAVKGCLPGLARTIDTLGALGHADDRVQDGCRSARVA